MSSGSRFISSMRMAPPVVSRASQVEGTLLGMPKYMSMGDASPPAIMASTPRRPLTLATSWGSETMVVTPFFAAQRL